MPTSARPDRARSDGPAAARTSACPNPGGISSTWWVTRTRPRGDGLAARRPRSRTSASRAPRSRLAPGSSRISRSGFRHQGPGDLDPPLLARRQRPERVVVEAAGADLIEEPAGAVAVGRRVGVPPRSEGGVPGGDDDVEGRQARVDRRLEAGARVADLAPEVAGVDPADRLAEDLDRAGGRPEIGARDVDERRLARSVRAKDDPALAVADGPVDRPRIVRPERRTETPVNRRITLAMLPGPIAGRPLMRVPGIRAFAPTQPAATTGFDIPATRIATSSGTSSQRPAERQRSSHVAAAAERRRSASEGLPARAMRRGPRPASRSSNAPRRRAGAGPASGGRLGRRPRRLDSRRSSGDRREGSTACRRAGAGPRPKRHRGSAARPSRAGEERPRRPARAGGLRGRCPAGPATARRRGHRLSALGPGDDAERSRTSGRREARERVTVDPRPGAVAWLNPATGTQCVARLAGHGPRCRRTSR